MITLNEISKKFRRREVIKQVSQEFGNGVYGLLGSNGAGKTTLMRCILGLYPVNGGEILYNGKSIKNNETLNRNAGYLPQKFGLFKELKVYDMLTYFACAKKIPKEQCRHEIEECIEAVNLSDRLYDRVGGL